MNEHDLIDASILPTLGGFFASLAGLVVCADLLHTALD